MEAEATKTDDPAPIIREAVPKCEPIPGEIVNAICRVQMTVSAVARDGKNQHGGYQYASTDAVYAALTLKLAEVGLAIICLEEAEPVIKRVEANGKTVQWGKFVFSYILAAGGKTWTDPRLRRTLLIQITGPQTFMSAQSYAEKALLRSLFKLPTGDLDLDAMPQAETEEDQVALAGNSGRKRKSSAASKRDGTDARFNVMRGHIAAAISAEALRELRASWADEIEVMPERWSSLIEDDYEARMSDLTARAA